MNKSSLNFPEPWLSPPFDPFVPPGTIDIWRGRLDVPQPDLHNFWSILNREEQARASRFKFPEHQHRFTAARGMLRWILARYLKVDPIALIFATGPHGKPFLVNISSHSLLSFNVAHSHQLALYAITQNREVGVDIEKLRSDIDYEGMVPRIFTRQEAALFWALPPKEREKAFFSCWTKKEAYLKARGEGLAFSLKKVSILSESGPIGQIQILDDPEETNRWRVQELHPGEGYAAAVVAEKQDWNLRQWDFFG